MTRTDQIRAKHRPPAFVPKVVRPKPGPALPERRQRQVSLQDYVPTLGRQRLPELDPVEAVAEAIERVARNRGRIWNEATGYMELARTRPRARRNKQAMYRMQDRDGALFRVLDRSTGQALGQVRGCYAHVQHEATRLALSLGARLPDLKLEVVEHVQD
ncbi:hypothetical protein ACUN0C_18640 [Faunimonas sp. B44]|uniref:hypothetical protein n=1 Tax=Faunimonas sp. B44 TaxID=3461493 RepID=UPI0040446973